MYLFKRIWHVSILTLLVGCNLLKQSPKYELTEGFYKTKLPNQNTSVVYVTIHEDSLKVYPAVKNQVDTSKFIEILMHEPNASDLLNQYTFSKKSFDVDILTIPFKYRPYTAHLPNQLNTNFNGAVYLGYRADGYRLNYQKTPLHIYQNTITHYGYSVGIFGGLGATAMNPWVTQNQISLEYDGVVFTKGIAAIVGIDKFNFGLGIGLDHLLDHNQKFWIYQNKVWIGLTLGLNLN